MKLNMKGSIALLLVVAVGATLGAIQKRATGKDCPDDEGRHHVIITTTGDDLGHCGGSLLSPEWVITAGHCDEPNLEVIVGYHPGRKGIKKTVDEKIKFKDDSDVFHDLMLLRINNKDTNLIHISLPDLQTCKTPPIDEEVEFVGLQPAKVKGDDKFLLRRRAGDILQCGTLDVVKCRNCPPVAHEHHVCGLDSHKKCDGCPGDSGSSLKWNGMLHGVLQKTGIYAVDDGSGSYPFCAVPVRFMNLCHKEYREWISVTTGGL